MKQVCPQVDLGVYANYSEALKSLRFINSIKIDDKEIKIINRRFITTRTPNDMAVTLIDGYYRVQLPPVFDDSPIFEFEGI